MPATCWDGGNLGSRTIRFGASRARDHEWHAVLEPPRFRRLAEVCQLIASRAARPVIRPSRLLGSTCGPAGAFLTIRSLLHEAGAPADEIAPSTPLAHFTRRFARCFSARSPASRRERCHRSGFAHRSTMPRFGACLSRYCVCWSVRLAECICSQSSAPCYLCRLMHFGVRVAMPAARKRGVWKAADFS